MKAIDFSGKNDIPFLLWAESFHYVLATIAVTLTIGTALGYVLCRTFSQIGLLGKLNYTFPLLPMLIFFVALIVIALEYSALASVIVKKDPCRVCEGNGMIWYLICDG